MNQKFKILCCDGGGIRGLLTILLLEKLETEINNLDKNASLATCFDLFAGTSTGSIIACGLAKGMNARTIREFYEREGEKIFPTMNPQYWLKETLQRIQNLDVSLPLFQAQDLEAVLTSEDIFPKSLLLSSLPKPVLVTSYDTHNREAVVFKSQDQKFATIPVWQVCRSSAAAPTAFSAYLLKDEQFLKALTEDVGNFEGDLPKEIPPKGIPLIDGGVVANNPALCAIAEHISDEEESNVEGKIDFNNIVVASFGTGQLPRRIDPDEAVSWGGWDWVDIFKGIPLLDVFSDGSADAVDYVASKLLRKNYYRFQPVLEKNTSTFQADPDNLNLLRTAARNYLERQEISDRFNQLAQVLIIDKLPCVNTQGF